MRALALCFALFANAVPAHEVWLEPLDYTVPTDGMLQAHLVNGEEFEGTNFPYLMSRLTRFDMALGETTRPVENLSGSKPILDNAPLGDGLHVVAYVSTLSRLTYDDWAAWGRFAAHKDFATAEADHLARGLPQTGFTEVYSRHVKTLIAVGDGDGADQAMGLETEFVALMNPYTDDLSQGLQVQLFYQGVPRGDAQVELFAKAPDGTVEITLHRTDADGIATLPARAGYSYLADAVVLREPAPDLAAEKDAVWETLWAALTFAVPAD